MGFGNYWETWYTEPTQLDKVIEVILLIVVFIVIFSCLIFGLIASHPA